MKEVDPGHEYLLNSYDGGESVRLVFVKREGEGYPFNVGHHPGTNCQEVIRVLIARVKYLQRQIPCEENGRVINNLRSCLWEFEKRAAQRHGRASVIPWQEQYQPIPIEEQPTCAGCGHIGCEGNHKARATTPPATPVVAARAAAEEISAWIEDDTKQRPSDNEIAAIITKHFAATTSPTSETAVGGEAHPLAEISGLLENHPLRDEYLAEVAAVPAAGADDFEKRARKIVDDFRYGYPPVQSLRFLEWEPLVVAITAALRSGEK